MAERRKLSEGGTGIYDLVVVRNTGRQMITLRHKEMGDVDLLPGKQRTIPVGIALVNLGNPGARDNGRKNDRTMEIHRVQRKWGYNRGFYTETAWFEKGKDTTTGEEVGPFCPTVECYSLDGERMYFIHDDPKGVKNTRDLSRLEEAASDDRYVHQSIEQLQEQMTRLQDLIASKAEGEDGKDASDFLAPSIDIPEAALEALGITKEQMAQALALAAGVTDDETVDKTDDSAVDDTPPPSPPPDAVVGGQSQAERNEQRDQIPSAPATEPPLTKDKPATPRVGGGKSK